MGDPSPIGGKVAPRLSGLGLASKTA